MSDRRAKCPATDAVGDPTPARSSTLQAQPSGAAPLGALFGPSAASAKAGAARRTVLRSAAAAGLWWGAAAVLGAGSLSGCASTPPAPPPPREPRRLPAGAPTGRLLVIGGGQDRVDANEVLRRFMEVSGGPMARLRFITGATNDPKGAERAYGEAMQAIGAANVDFLHLQEAADASHPELLKELRLADGVFITGGDQRRLMQKLWSTPAMAELHTALRERGICLAGTSAGAAAMSRAMIAQGPATIVPQKEVVSLDLGLNFMPQALVDQHFSQRRRLSRLLSAVAQRPDLLGIGIDEDTGLLIEWGRSLEVIGRSSVTIVDGSDMQTNAREVEPSERLELIGVNLHVLPTGRRYRHPQAGDGADLSGVPTPPKALEWAFNRLLEPPPILVM